MTNAMTPHTGAGGGSLLPPDDEYTTTIDLATRLAGTEFVPSGFRGPSTKEHPKGEPNPAAVIAAMLTGRELGLGPMESLRSIHMIDGRPTLSADATMQLAMSNGHRLIVVEQTDERATVRYRNASWPDDVEDMTVTFTMADADRAGLTEGKRGAMWRKYPRAMLRSRAITEAARTGGLLSSAGVAYTAEEIAPDEYDETIVVQSVSPDDDDVAYAVEVERQDVDETAERREIHRRTVAALQTIRERDGDDVWQSAWSGLTEGLPGEHPIRDGDLRILRRRVDQLEAIAARTGGAPPADDEPDDEPDDDDGGGGVEPDDEPDDDGGPTAPAVDDADVATCDRCDEPLDDDGDFPTHGAPAPPETPAEVAEAINGSLGDGTVQVGTSTVDERKRDAIVAAYDDLNVGQVSELLRSGSIDVKIGTVPVTLGLDDRDALIALVDRLEDKRDGGRRKSVDGVLDSIRLPEPTRPNVVEVPADDEPDEEANPEPDADPAALYDRWDDAYERVLLTDRGRAKYLQQQRKTNGVASRDDWITVGGDPAGLAIIVSLTRFAENMASELAAG